MEPLSMPSAQGEEKRALDLCCTVFDPTVKRQDCVNKINRGSGVELVSTWQELVIEYRGPSNMDREKQEGVERDLETQGLFGLGHREETCSFVSLVEKEVGQLVASQLL